MVALTLDAKQVAKMQKTVGKIKDGVPRVLAAAINRALDKGKATVKREIRKVYLIKAKDIPIAVERANFTTKKGHIILRQGMLPLSMFPFTPKNPTRGKRRRELHARVKRGGGGVIRSGFVAAFETSHTGPYKRRGKARLPIAQLWTIGAPIMASQPNVGPEVNKQMGDTLGKRIDHEIKRVLAKGK
jgi:hypothetical protein